MSQFNRGSSSTNWRERPSGSNNEQQYFKTPSSSHGHSRGKGGGGGGGGSGGGGHPPGLSGKAIGLYYRDKARKEKKQQNKKTKKDQKETQIFTLRPRVEQEIRRLIEDPRSSYDKQFNMREDFSNSNSASSCYNKNDGMSDNSFEARYNHINDSQFKKKFLSIISGNLQDNLARALVGPPKLRRDGQLDRQLYNELCRNRESNQNRNMARFRTTLPAFEKRKEILDLIDRHQVVVISGETGCGKTTQVAQFILDNEIECGRGSITSIACTQPRRISAITVAERVAAERGENLGKSVGFHIRLERKLARPYGSIVFCTTGMLLQFMQMDPALQNYSHIILDEIHERSTQSDFIITLLKQIIPKRPDLKVILMSATLNSDQFSAYYERCPMIHIPGFTYPVEEYYLEDAIALTKFRFQTVPPIMYGKKKKGKKIAQLQKQMEFNAFIEPYIRHLQHLNTYPSFVFEELKNPKSEELSVELVIELTRHICRAKDDGAILIFLPGITDISKCHKMMLDSGYFPRDNYCIYPLHSRMPTVDQKLIFEVPPRGVRKIVIATNIAETSITIEDVVYVIDCGKIKMSNFDVVNNLQTLEAEWVSQANAKQRKGRAGRVRPGECYHLYTKARAHKFEQYPLPEMLRTRLEEVILQVKILQIGKANTFLASVMDPPDPVAINLSIDLLKQLNALDDREILTPLGYHLAQLPLDPRTGKMILWAAMFSCIDPIFSIAASLSFKDAFYCPLGKEEEARSKKLALGLNQFSDHIALAEALKRFEMGNMRGSSWSFCREYFLSPSTLKLLSEMKQQFGRYLYEMRFLRNENPNDDQANRNSHNLSLIKAIVCAGLYPNVAIVKKGSKNGVRCVTTEKELVKLHPSSVNDKMPKFPTPYLTYFLKRKSTAIYLFDTTAVSHLALLFASPNNSLVQRKGTCTITIGNNLSFQCAPGTAQIIQKLHEKLDSMLEYKIAHPGTVDWNAYEGNILKAIIILLSEGDEEMGMDSGRYHAWEDFDEDWLDDNSEYDD